MKHPRKFGRRNTAKGLMWRVLVLACVLSAVMALASAARDYRVDQGPGARYDREDPAMGVPEQPDSGAPRTTRRTSPRVESAVVRLDRAALESDFGGRWLRAVSRWLRHFAR